MSADRRLNSGAILVVAPILVSIVFVATPQAAGGPSQRFYTNGVDRKYMWTTSISYLITGALINPAARQPTGELLRMEIVQQTIQEVLDCTRKFKEAEPESARLLGL